MHRDLKLLHARGKAVKALAGKIRPFPDLPTFHFFFLNWLDRPFPIRGSYFYVSCVQKLKTDMSKGYTKSL
jgi:hypothetical protein